MEPLICILQYCVYCSLILEQSTLVYKLIVYLPSSLSPPAVCIHIFIFLFWLIYTFILLDQGLTFINNQSINQSIINQSSINQSINQSINLNQQLINLLINHEIIQFRSNNNMWNKVLMQGKLIVVAYTLRTYWNQFSLGGIFKQE